VIAVEHDLSVLDYLSDFICVLYGVPGAYGVVSLPFSVREGAGGRVSALPVRSSVCMCPWVGGGRCLCVVVSVCVCMCVCLCRVWLRLGVTGA
jgi:hypothetical protein